MKKKSLNKIKQMVSIGMSCIMAGSTWSTWNLPTVLHAEEVHTESVQVEGKQEEAVHTGAAQPTYRITSFDELGEEIAYQTLPIGAEESEINFPDTLKVSVIRQVEEEPEEPTTEAEEEKTTTETEEETIIETEEETETTTEVFESQTEAESQTEVETEVESESESQIEAELQTEVESQTKVEIETLESEYENETSVTETELPETTALPEPQTQEPETTVSESETESTEQLESDTTEEESSIVASLIDNIKGLFAPVEVYAAEELLVYNAGGKNSAEDSVEGEEWIIEHITWKLDAEKSSLPEFNSSEESAGAVYFYTPTIPEIDENGNHYILSEEAILPEICVMVDGGVDNGIALYSNIVDSGTCGAEGNNGDNLTWTLDNEGVLTISGTGAMENWNRQNEIYSPWYENEKIKSIVIENGVTSIGQSAFYRCRGLTNIKIPNSVTSIEKEAFMHCQGLINITIPNSVTSIKQQAFYSCFGLTNIMIPNSVTSIGVGAFGHCMGLTSITIPNSITSIETLTFSECKSLTSVTLPNSVTSIGVSAFEGCVKLTNIALPNSVTSIETWAFYSCIGLTSVTLPNSVTSIGVGAFEKCRKLTSVTIPNSVTSIGSHAFGYSITNAVYLGTAEQWNNLKKNIGNDNDALLNNVKFHEHSPEIAWSNNATYHWHQCTDEACPVKEEPQAQDRCDLHEWKNGICSECGYICKHTGGTVTCIAKAVCTTCGQPYGEVDSSNHTGKEKWIQTEKTHEKKWSCCDLVTVKEEVHEWKDGICEECEYVCQHKDDNSDHLCDICNKKISDHIGGTATCIAKAVCTICNQLYGEVDSSNHTGKEEWIQTVKTHEKKWNCCDLVTVKEEIHEWKDGVCEECGYICKHTGGTATCTEKAVCTECGIEYGEVDSKNHDILHHEAKAATCTEIGWEAYDTCKREGCNYTTYKKLPALKHDLEHHGAKAATCTEIGWNAYDTCKREDCDYTTYVELPALDHDLEHHEAKAATCTEIGWEAYDTCKREGCEYTTYKELPALKHDLEHHEEKAPTCTEIGWDVYDTCKREGCIYSTYNELAALDHDLEHHEAKAATCTEIGWEAYDTCKREGCTYSTYVELPALDHDLEHHEAKAATCTEIGWEAYDTCKRDGCKYTTYAELPALKHDLEHHEAKAATCTEIGWDAYDTCTREGCGYTTYKELPALGHKDSNNDHLCDACSTKISAHTGGIATCKELATCDICGEPYGELDKENHTGETEIREEVEATCTENGYTGNTYCKDCNTKLSSGTVVNALGHNYENKITREATTTDTGIRTYTCTKCGHSYTEELAKLSSQTNQVNQSNQADQTNSVESANNGNEKDFIGTVTSVFFNVTGLAAKNFRMSLWLLIQMFIKALLQVR